MSFRLIVDGREITKDGVTKNGIPNSYSWIMNNPNDEERYLCSWSRYPQNFIEQVLGINKENGYEFSEQQKELFIAIGDLAYSKKMIWDMKKTPEKIPRQVKEFAKNLGISVRSAKGCGKTATSTLLILWFLCTNKLAKIPVIGPTEVALKTVLWAELSKWLQTRNHDGIRLLQEPYASKVRMDQEKIYIYEPESGHQGTGWSAYIRVASRNADKTVTEGVLSGLHEDSILAIMDEAAVLPREIFNPIMNTFTRRCNIALLLFNPSRTEGYAFDTHMHPEISKYWIKLHWDAEESPEFIISREHIERLEAIYGGKDTNNYNVFVKGNFPTLNDGSLIPFNWCYDAIDRDVGEQKEDVVVGGDIARDGGDATIACVRQGAKILDLVRINKVDSIDVAVEFLKIAKKYNAKRIYIDAIGVGSGVYDQLRRLFPETTAVIVSESAQNPSKFHRLRDELWWRCRIRFEKKAISIPDNNDLIKQLSTIQYTDMLAGGKIKIEAKADMKKRLGGDSPDYADALCLTFYYDDFDTINSDFFSRTRVTNMFTRARERQYQQETSQWAN